MHNTTTTEKPFSDTVKALLIYSKKTESDFTIKSLIADCLGNLYHHEMRIKDVLVVLTNALEELYSIKEFEAGRKENLLLDLLKAPFDGARRLHDPVWGPKLEQLCPVESFYDSIVAEMLYKFKFTNVGWCRKYLFPNEE